MYVHLDTGRWDDAVELLEQCHFSLLSGGHMANTQLCPRLSSVQSSKYPSSSSSSSSSTAAASSPSHQRDNASIGSHPHPPSDHPTHMIGDLLTWLSGGQIHPSDTSGLGLWLPLVTPPPPHSITILYDLCTIKYEAPPSIIII